MLVPGKVLCHFLLQGFSSEVKTETVSSDVQARLGLGLRGLRPSQTMSRGPSRSLFWRPTQAGTEKIWFPCM